MTAMRANGSEFPVELAISVSRWTGRRHLRAICVTSPSENNGKKNCGEVKRFLAKASI